MTAANATSGLSLCFIVIKAFAKLRAELFNLRERADSEQAIFFFRERKYLNAFSRNAREVLCLWGRLQR